MFQTGDLIIFRLKNIDYGLRSIIRLNLDNHVGMIVKNPYLDGIIKLGIYLLETKNNQINLTPFDLKENEEYYYYKLDNVNLDRDQVNQTINNLLNEKTLITKGNWLNNLLNGQILLTKTCNDEFLNTNVITRCYQEWGLLDKKEEYKYLNPNQIRDLDLNNGNLRYLFGNNVGEKPDLTNYNPYLWSYLVSPFIEYFLIKRVLKDKLPELTKGYRTELLVIFCALFGMISGRMMALYQDNFESEIQHAGMSMIGPFFFLLSIVLLLEYFYKIDSLKMLDAVVLVVGVRIFLTRLASWLINDLTGKINPKTNTPYDTTLWEAIFEGLVPLVTVWILNGRVKDGILFMIWITMYTTFRWYIEYFKNPYLENSNLTQGQIDCIPMIFIAIYIYLTRKYNIKDYKMGVLIFILYLDLENRIKINKKYQYNYGNLEIIYQKERNNNLIFGLGEDLNKNIKLLIHGIGFISAIYQEDSLLEKITIGLISSLNIGERLLTNNVTDYVKVKYQNYESSVFNYSDILITCNSVYNLMNKFKN